MWVLLLRSYSHQWSASMQSQRWDDASDFGLIENDENNRVTPEWGCNPFLSDSIDFNESCITSVVVALRLTLDIKGS